MPRDELPIEPEVYDKNNKQDIRNFTEVPEDFFDQIHREIDNNDEILKIVDSVKLKHPIYYVFTDFLIDREY